MFHENIADRKLFGNMKRQSYLENLLDFYRVILRKH